MDELPKPLNNVLKPLNDPPKPLNRFEKRIRSLQRQMPDRMRMPAYQDKYQKPTNAQRIQMMNDQDGYCAICFEILPEQRNRQHADHCHETLLVRGLLCGNCNAGIGMLKDDPAILRHAAEYIEGWREKHAQIKSERERRK